MDELSIKDPIHGTISLPSIVKTFVDTEEFQRLRYIKQTALAHYVYPSLTHTRFEHCVGTAYMCGEFLKSLKEKFIASSNKVKTFGQPENLITEKEIICVQLAGLLHDIGHGPFSHTFEKLKIDDSTSHEDMSCGIIDLLVLKYKKIRDEMIKYGLTLNDIELIKMMIKGLLPDDQIENYEIPTIEYDINKYKISEPFKSLITNSDQCDEDSSSQYLFSNLSVSSNDAKNLDNLKQEVESDLINKYSDSNSSKSNSTNSLKKWFLFQIVSNKFSGIDCDKFDYLMRDSFYIGLKCNFDYKRYFHNCSLVSTDNDGILICPRDKEIFDINELFHCRWNLHMKVYQHKTVKAVDFMLIRALQLADPVYNWNNIFQNVENYVKLTDHIFHEILYSTDVRLEDSRRILNFIIKRKIIKICGKVSIPKNFRTQNIETIINEICELDDLDNKRVFGHFISITSGSNSMNPMKNMNFYVKTGQIVKLKSDSLSKLISNVHSGKILQIYYNNLFPNSFTDDDSYKERITNSFNKWCTENNLTLPEVVESTELSDIFTQVSIGTPIKRKLKNLSFSISKRINFG